MAWSDCRSWPRACKAQSKTVQAGWDLQQPDTSLQEQYNAIRHSLVEAPPPLRRRADP